MELSLPVYLICLGSMVVLTIGIAAQAFLNWQRPGARTLGFLMLCMSIWAGFYMLEILHPELSVKITARKMLYLGMMLSPPLWLGFALRYTGISAWWSKRGHVILLTIPGFIAFLLGTTNDWHSLIWSSMRLPASQPGALLLDLEPGFWIFAFIAYILIGIGLVVYTFVYFQSEKAFRVKTGVILVGALITTLVNIFFLIEDSTPALDPTPLSFVISAPLLAFGFFRYGVSSLLPLASNMVMDGLRDAIIIVGTEDRITDANLAAKKLLGIEIITDDMDIFSLLPQQERFREVWNENNANLILELPQDEGITWYEARIIPLTKHNRELIGRVIIFHDVTTEQALLRAEKRRSEQLTLLEETGRIVANSFDEKEILQRAVDAIIQRFRYPEAAISVLTPDDMLEVAVIAGTEDFGYQPGYRQKLGEGIIGHTAMIQKTYIAENVANDPYYFSNEQHFGAAICTPIWKQEKLFGVLYVESLEPHAFDVLDIKTMETLSSQISESLQRASLHAEAQENLHILSVIQDISKSIASSLDMETVANLVMSGLRDAFGYTHISIYLLETEYLQLVAEVGYPTENAISKIHVSQGVNGKAVRTKAIQFIEDTTKETIFLKSDESITSEICIPLMKENTVLGTLNVEANSSRPLTETDVNLLATIAGPIALAIDNARLHAQIKKLATTDAVTGLANRHVFEQSLASEIERAQRTGGNLSLIIFDIDSFKEYNDTWGHPAGDSRLKAVGEIVQKNLRKYDVAARYGGDEFAVILSNTDSKNAQAFAERLYQAAQAGAPPSPSGTGVPGYTLSMGIATFPQDASNQQQLLVAADNAALRSKHLGKNRIQLAGDLENGPN